MTTITPEQEAGRDFMKSSDETPTAYKAETPSPQKNGIDLIAAERQRQLLKERWSAEHDDSEHTDGTLALAAASYAHMSSELVRGIPFEKASGISQRLWPWGDYWWKPSSNPIRNLEKAGALIAAEIDRLLRLKTREDETVPDGNAAGADQVPQNSASPAGQEEKEREQT